jgi:hypothetical protein
VSTIALPVTDPELSRQLAEERAKRQREKEEMELEKRLDDDVGQSHTDSLEQVRMF